jgi:hypothetical protein
MKPNIFRSLVAFNIAFNVVWGIYSHVDPVPVFYLSYFSPYVLPETLGEFKCNDHTRTYLDVYSISIQER